jgi:hypothetical protein
VVVKPLPHLLSPYERVGGAFFFVQNLQAIPQGFVSNIVFSRVNFILCNFEHWVLAIPSSFLVDLLSLCSISSSHVFYPLYFMQYLHFFF